MDLTGPLIAVFTWAYATQHKPNLTPMPDLQAAVQTLAAPSHDPLAALTRRLAIAKLAPLQDAEARAATQRLRDAQHETDSTRGGPTTLDAGNGGDCLVSSSSQIDEATDLEGGKRVEIELTLRGTLDASMKGLLDPQTWDECLGSHGFMKRAWVVAGAPAAGSHQVCVLPKPAPPERGSTWQGLLYEQFENEYGVPAAFHNLLAIKMQSGTEGLGFTYALKRSLLAKVSGCDQQDGESNKLHQRGKLTASPVPDGVRIRAHKEFKLEGIGSCSGNELTEQTAAMLEASWLHILAATLCNCVPCPQKTGCD